MAEPLLHKGYLIWTYKFYSFPDLVRLLISEKIDCTGTSKTKQEVL